MALQAISGVSGYSAGDAFFPFDHEYYDQLSIGRPLLQVAGLDIFAGDALENHANKVDDTTLLEFAAKFYEVALVLDVLRGAREQRTFRRALDIASGPGLQVRLLRLLGHVNNAEAIDIYDGSRRCGDPLLRSLARRLRLVFLAYRAQKLLPASVRRLVPRLERLNRKFPLGVEEFGRHPDERPFGRRLRTGSSLSRYHVGDVFELEGRYDLLRAVSVSDAAAAYRRCPRLLPYGASGGAAVWCSSAAGVFRSRATNDRRLRADRLRARTDAGSQCSIASKPSYESPSHHRSARD